METVVGEQIRAASKGIMHERSDDELMPPVSKEDLAAHTSNPVLDTNWNESGDGQTGGCAGNPPAPKRTGSTPDSPSSQRPKVDERDDNLREDKVFAV